MKMSVQTIIDEARTQWVEPDPLFITNVEALRWVNMAQADFVKRTKCLRHSVQISTVANKQDYALGIDARIIDVLWILCEGKPLSPCTREQLDMCRPNWRYASGGTPGLPEFYYITNVYDEEIGFYPCPDEKYTISLYVAEEAPVIENSNLSTTYPKIDDACHDALAYFVEWRGHQKNRNFDMAANARKVYDAQVEACLVTFMHMQPERISMMSGPEYATPARNLRMPQLPPRYGRVY